MRRTPLETLPSLRILISPISPVAATCVPPQSSVEKSAILRTRTFSPYFSPKSAMAWYSLTATSMGTSSMVSTRLLQQNLAVGDVLDLLQLFVGDRGEVREVEAQIVGRDQRAGLLDVGSEHLAQRGVEQVGRRVMAARGRAQLGVDDGDELFADGDGLAGDDLVRANALHRRVYAFDFGDDHGVVGGVEPAFVANLAAALGVEGSVVEDQLGLVWPGSNCCAPWPFTTMARTSQLEDCSCV